MRLAEALTPAVVNVRTAGEVRRSRTPNVPEPFRRFLPQPPEGGGEREQRPRGVGSGFIIDADGYIVTNHHVVDGSKSIEVQLSDGRTFQPKVIGSDPETDIALLKIDATGLPMIPLGSSSALRVAEPVMAIGNPFGFDHTVTVGIVSGTGRFIGQGRFDDFIQTDAAINPGNSGGPLINTRGEAVGINSAIRSSSGGFQGIGFAIPVDLAKPILGQLRASGKVTRGWLGVAIQPLTQELAKSFGLTGTQGALVASVSEDSPRPAPVSSRATSSSPSTARRWRAPACCRRWSPTRRWDARSPSWWCVTASDRPSASRWGASPSRERRAR